MRARIAKYAFLSAVTVNVYMQSNHLFGKGPVRIKYLKKTKNGTTSNKTASSERSGTGASKPKVRKAKEGGKVEAPGKTHGATPDLDSRCKSARLIYCLKRCRVIPELPCVWFAGGKQRPTQHHTGSISSIGAQVSAAGICPKEPPWHKRQQGY